ncbi:DUF6653 family protein [Polycladidibacter hongkongensis]|uniref:DUF6653 family protein n=1 Tax=Polycladidibacter hongkongensis TaxID=1647556 RepID=UPI00082FC8C8|nr:DUF6653 family protein [Pseudovibrio hongkongensis]
MPKSLPPNAKSHFRRAPQRAERRFVGHLSPGMGKDTARLRSTSWWSLGLRAITLPLLQLALWQKHQFDWPHTLAALIVLIAWTLASTRIAAGTGPKQTWYAHAIFGERVWLNQRLVPVPQRQNLQALALQIASFLCFAAACFFAYAHMLLPAMAATLICHASKAAQLNILAQLYIGMTKKNPVYRTWLRTPQNDNSKRAKSS